MGGMELKVGSNMIIFLYFVVVFCFVFLLILIWHMHFFGVFILYIVSCHNYMYYDCEN